LVPVLDPDIPVGKTFDHVIENQLIRLRIVVL
jgi:hypothetical protein